MCSSPPNQNIPAFHSSSPSPNILSDWKRLLPIPRENKTIVYPSRTSVFLRASMLVDMSFTLKYNKAIQLFSRERWWEIRRQHHPGMNSEDQSTRVSNMDCVIRIFSFTCSSFYLVTSSGCLWCLAKQELAILSQFPSMSLRSVT